MKSTIRYFVTNPLLTWLVIIFLILSGVLALASLRSEAFPAVDFQQVKITTVFPGAPASDVEQLVTIPIEEKLREVDGLDGVKSISRQSVSEITVKIDLEVDDPDAVVEEIRRALDQVTDLPVEVTEKPLFEERNSNKFPIIEIALYGDATPRALYETSRLVEWELEKIPGVARVDPFGRQDREWHVLANPTRMRERIVSLGDMIRAIRERNINVPAGAVAAGKAVNIRTTGEFEDVRQILSLPIQSNDIGDAINIGDVAEVRDTFERPEFLASTNTLPAITLQVIKKEQADILHTVDLVQARLYELESVIPDGVGFKIIHNEAARARNRLDVVVSNALIGFCLVIAILVLFLNTRDALLTSLSLPMTLLGTIVFFPLYDITFNLISMLGMIIALGMLVDNSIVISENVYRYREQGLDPTEAAIRGTSELIIPITGTYLTTIAAFAPMMFMSGLMGKFVWQIPFVVIVTLTVSLFESFFLLPARIARFGRDLSQARISNPVRAKINGFIHGLRGAFRRFISWTVRRRYVALLSIFTVLGLAVFAQTMMKFNLFPKEGVETFIIKVEFPPHFRVESTMERMAHVENVVRRLPDSEMVSYAIKAGVQQRNAQDILARVGEHLGMLQVRLTPELTRVRTARQIIESMATEINAIPDAREILIEEIVPSPPIGAAITLGVQGRDYEKIQEIVQEVTEFLKNQAGVKNISSDYKPGREEQIIMPNDHVAAQAGVTMRMVANSVRAVFEGAEASTLRRGADEITIRVLYNDEHRGSLQALQDVAVRNKIGLYTNLPVLTRMESRSGPEALLHFDFERAVTITADVDDEVITSVEANAIVLEKFYDIPERFPGYTISFRGEQKSTQRSMASLARSGIVAFFAIYAIIALIFNHWIKPLVITFAISLGIIGVSLGFLTAGRALSFFAMIGLIGLAGVVVNASIVLVDFIEQLRADSNDPYADLSEAASIRFRPILLTTLTTMAGLLPTAYGIGGSDPVLIPMTLALAWGLATGTLGALVFIPCTFAVGYDIQRNATRLLNWMKK